MLFGFAASLWSANQGIKALFDALNVVNDEKESRGFLHRTALTLAFTLGALLFIMLALAAVVAVPAILAFVGLGGVLDFVLRFARWPVLLAAIGLFLALIYRYGPSREAAKWRWVSWGSAFAAVAWVIGSAGFSWYVQLRQLQQNLWFAGRGGRFHDLDLDFHHHHPGRRRTER